MVTIPNTIGSIFGALILCVGLSYVYAAHPQAETDQSADRGSQGNQDMIKGDSTPKKGQEGKVDETKLKEEKKQAKEEFDKRNAAGREEMNRKVPLKPPQNN